MRTWADNHILVRSLLKPCLIMGALAFIPPACVVPPHQELVGEPNTAPQFVVIATTPDPTQLTTQKRSPSGEPPQTLPIASRVVDPDPQRLSLRAFGDADYERPIEISPDSIDPVTRADGLRLFETTITGLCDSWLQPQERQYHILELYVTDGEFEGPTGRGVIDGQRDSITWVIFCEDLPR